ncbi:ImmA/IrrE family metallo-endopeptidase [Paenarthrobacter nitroguajacolicus]|uniref:ImmA/IrrE family metallo-endopeptidase n=1 Tax=Paenarthrobacter nitroguajacolicus TaxID=211146 RepID=UPI003AE27BF5
MAAEASELNYKAIGEYAEFVGRHYGIHSNDGPADIEALVRDLGGRIEYAESNESMHVRSKGDFTIYLSEYTSRRRDRFTIAHELGHYYLHYVHPEKTTEDGFGRGERNLVETQANVFAASLLMPADLFKAAHRELGGESWSLAERFGVSPSAAGVRCQVLGLAVR